MPNYIQNKLEINGSQYLIDQMVEQHGKDKFPDFNLILQPPTENSVDIRWRIDNWGTKWNSNVIKNDGNVFIYETAWSPTPLVIQELSAMYPDLELVYTYADEDAGYNCGEMIFKEGTVTFENIPNGGSKDAMELFFELHSDMKQYFKFCDKENNYIFVDED